MNAYLVYVYEDGKWRHGTTKDSTIKVGGYACTKERLGGYFKDTKDNYHVCTAQDTPDTLRKWVAASTLDNDTYEARSECSASTDGDLMNGRVNTSKVYACNGVNGWREISDELSKTLGGCYTNLIDSVGLYGETYYVCSNAGWEKANDIQINTYHYDCKKNGDLMNGRVNTDKYYTCDADTFRVETDLVAIEYFKKACVSYIESPTKVTSKNGTQWTCENSKWIWDKRNSIVGTMTDNRDGKEYKTTIIGSQTWMAENLNYGHTGVPYKYGSYISDSTSWCYDNNASNCDKYGRLYTWAAAMDSAGVFSTTGKDCGNDKICDVASIGSAIVVQGVCPEGWHLPRIGDWNALFAAVGGTRSAANTMLKSTSGWNSDDNGTDDYGFSILPAGFRYYRGDFLGVGSFGGFWSSTEDDRYDGENLGYHAYSADFGQYHLDGDEEFGNKYRAFSVRCLKD